MDVRSVLKTVRGSAAAVVLGASLALASGCSGTGMMAGSTISVGDGGVFNPASVTIKAGESVTWRNVSSTTQVVSGDRFGSALTPGGSFSQTFLAVGTYPFTGASPNVSGLVIVVQ